MRITRLYTDQPLGNISSVKLDKHASNHILRVLRLKPGAKLVLFNGDGYEYPATLDSVQRNVATVILQPGQAVDRESPLQVSLVQGISRGERMDYTLQKAV
jgi:16S rRNA (uracil1498-N3)-methyltransferase